MSALDPLNSAHRRGSKAQKPNSSPCVCWVLTNLKTPRCVCARSAPLNSRILNPSSRTNPLFSNPPLSFQSCGQAIKAWEAKNEAVAEESDVVKVSVGPHTHPAPLKKRTVFNTGSTTISKMSALRPSPSHLQARQLPQHSQELRAPLPLHQLHRQDLYKFERAA